MVPFRLVPTAQRQLRLTWLVICSVFPQTNLYFSWCCMVADDEGVIIYYFCTTMRLFPTPGTPFLHPRLLVPRLLLCRITIHVSSRGSDLLRRTGGLMACAFPMSNGSPFPIDSAALLSRFCRCHQRYLLEQSNDPTGGSFRWAGSTNKVVSAGFGTLPATAFPQLLPQ